MATDPGYLVQIDQRFHRLALRVVVAKRAPVRQAMVRFEPIIQEEATCLSDPFVLSGSPVADGLPDRRYARRRLHPSFEQAQLSRTGNRAATRHFRTPRFLGSWWC